MVTAFANAEIPNSSRHIQSRLAMGRLWCIMSTKKDVPDLRLREGTSAISVRIALRSSVPAGILTYAKGNGCVEGDVPTAELWGTGHAPKDADICEADTPDWTWS